MQRCMLHEYAIFARQNFHHKPKIEHNKLILRQFFWCILGLGPFFQNQKGIKSVFLSAGYSGF